MSGWIIFFGLVLILAVIAVCILNIYVTRYPDKKVEDYNTLLYTSIAILLLILIMVIIMVVMYYKCSSKIGNIQ